MDESYLKRLARLIVRRSCRAGEGDRVMIQGREDAAPFVAALAGECLRAGAWPSTDIQVRAVEQALLRIPPRDEDDVLPESEVARYLESEVIIFIRDPWLLEADEKTPLERLKQRARAQAMINTHVRNNTRWAITAFPTALQAARMGMSLAELERLFLNACFIDWKAHTRLQSLVLQLFEGAREIHIHGGGIDLRFGLDGRRMLLCNGMRNVPGGEIYTSPVHESVNGIVCFDDAINFAGKHFDEILLEFRNGRLVQANAGRQTRELHAILDVDTGGRIPGEIGFGTNPAITRLTGDALLDEKAAGTIHLALGQSFAEAGGVNESALHWDLVKDLCKGGMIEVDGRVVFSGGKFQTGTGRKNRRV
ncbi:MAG: Aminopeptidase T [Myxococcota bacterium]|nr:Aminopeptidase T [Myxococcota bacterium]